MDAMVETVQNVGLAQEIQKGLATSQQKEPKWAEPEVVEQRKAALKEMGGEAIYKTRLGKADGESEDEAGVELLERAAKEDTSV